MIRYYELTDPLHSGEIIRQEGRKHYRFSFGPFQWERTTLFQHYLTQGSELYGCCQLLEEPSAQSLLMQRGRSIAAQLKRAEDLARQAHGQQTDQAGEPYTGHLQQVEQNLQDWEEKTAAWLHEICNYGGWTVEQLRQQGFSSRICRSVDLLTRKSNMTYGAYLTRLRPDRIARRVKIADLAAALENLDNRHLTDAQRSFAARCRNARKYLFGDIAEYTDTNDLSEACRPADGQVPAFNVWRQLRARTLGGRKIPHSLSNPVLRRVDEKLYLACFILPSSAAQLRQGITGRPVSWILADLKTGRPLGEMPCSRADFSDAEADAQIALGTAELTPDGNFFPETYAILDRVRSRYLQEGVLDQALYGQYLQRMLSAVPPGLHRFYRELSRI